MALQASDPVLIIDIGSSSVRAAVLLGDARETNLEGIKLPYRVRHNPEGGAEIDPHQLLHLVLTAISVVLGQAQRAQVEIKAIAMASLVGSLLGTDEAGEPLTPIYIYADRRGAELKTRIPDPDDYIQRTGCRPHPSYAPIRLMWLAQTQPNTFKGVQRWFQLGDWILFQLTGKPRISLSAASWSGLLNRHHNHWDAAVLALVGVRPESLSEVSDDPVQGLVPIHEERLNALRDALWFPAVGDGVASNIGSACARSDRVAIALGTSGALRVIMKGRPTVPAGLFAYCVDSERSLIGGALNDVGSMYTWLSQVLNLPPEGMAEAEALLPDAHGLTILPFLTGERAPGWQGDARAVFAGMNPDTTPAQIMRAGLEAVALWYARIWKQMREGLPELAQVELGIASGAPTNTPLWVRILADALNLSIVRADPEATLRGAVLLASGAEGGAMTSAHLRFDPTPEAHARYQEAGARHDSLYRQLYPSSESMV